MSQALEPAQMAMSYSSAVDPFAQKRPGVEAVIGSSDDERVVAHFDSAALDWKKIYSRRDVWGIIHQDRLSKTMAWIEALGLPQGARVLDAGCGAGLASLAMAHRGYEVEAVDAAASMVALTQQHASQGGLDARISARVAGIYKLPFVQHSFPLAVSLGVIPWLEDPQEAITELSRVLQPAGYLLFTADNRRRLAWLLDPFTSPTFRPIKNFVNMVLRRSQTRGWDGICSHQHSIAEIDAFLSHTGMKRVRFISFGFGPFTFAYRKALPEWLGMQVHNILQRLADAGFPGIRSVGAQYLILAQKNTALNISK